jgi:hypothetical protein
LKLPGGHHDASPSRDSQITGLKSQFLSVFLTTTKIKRRHALRRVFTEEFWRVLLIYRLSFWSAVHPCHRPAGKAAALHGMTSRQGRAAWSGVKMGGPAKHADHQTRESRSGDAMMATRRLPKLVAAIM